MFYVNKRSHFFFSFFAFNVNQHPKSERAEEICRQTKLLPRAMLCYFPGKSFPMYGNSSHVYWLYFRAVMVEGVQHKSTLSLPESWGIIHTPLWVIAALLPVFHFLVTISLMCLPPVKSFIIVEDCHFHTLYIILTPKSCEYCHQFYLDEAVLVWPWRKLFLNSICFQKQ